MKNNFECKMWRIFNCTYVNCFHRKPHKKGSKCGEYYCSVVDKNIECINIRKEKLLKIKDVVSSQEVLIDFIDEYFKKIDMK